MFQGLAPGPIPLLLQQVYSEEGPKPASPAASLRVSDGHGAGVSWSMNPFERLLPERPTTSTADTCLVSYISLKEFFSPPCTY